MNIWKFFWNIPKSGLFALVNKSNKRVYISHSRDIPSSLARLVRDIGSRHSIYKQLIKDVKKLEFTLLENINIYDSLLDIHCKMDYYITEYKQLGYEIYNSRYKLQKFKVRIDVELDRLVYVKLISKSYKQIVVGVFDNMDDAIEFSYIFDVMDIVIPVYSINNYTRSYILSLKK